MKGIFIPPVLRLHSSGLNKVGNLQGFYGASLERDGWLSREMGGFVGRCVGREMGG
jgi:hypothetical protein